LFIIRLPVVRASQARRKALTSSVGGHTPALLNALQTDGLIQRGQSDKHVHRTAGKAHLAENRGDGIEPEQPDQTPVETSNHKEDSSNYVNGLHQFPILLDH